jgi:TonB dependent receptor/TonB-dependent Receptor Plug Domain
VTVVAASALIALALPLGPARSAEPASVEEQGALAANSSANLPTVSVEAARLQTPEDSGSYSMSAQDIADLPAGYASTVTDVLAHMPGVAIDQNQQIHIRNTEGPQFQYQINGVLVPLDINTNPPFISMINPLFVRQLDLLTGVLPARYSYATGGVVDIQTKDGCAQGGGDASLLFGQRAVLQPSVQYAGCAGGLSSYVSAVYHQGNTAFSSATPGPDPIHNWTRQGQLFGFFSYPIGSSTKVSLIVSAARSTNQLPNVPDLPPQYSLAGVAEPPPSSAIDSYLNFRDYLGILALNGVVNSQLTYQLAVSAHTISQRFEPDPVGELIYQGVASTASHDDHDQTLEGDLSYALGNHLLGAGFYQGVYRVTASDSSLVFPADANGAQTSDVPVSVINNSYARNVISGVYVNDRWQMDEHVRLAAGVRWDGLSGFTSGHQVSPTIKIEFQPVASTTVHAGAARYLQVPSILGISPTAQAAFEGTTAAGPPGVSTPVTEDDRVVDVGIIHQATPTLSLALDNYYEWTNHYLDTGQFGVVPIFAPFNYGRGHIWGSELSVRFQGDALAAYANLTVGENWQRGVVTGQFNFPADELAYINSNSIQLDHQPLYGASAGASYRWHAWTYSADAVYSSGLRAGFADLERLPRVFQVNMAIERSFHVPGLGPMTNRITVLNVFDRVNLIRPAEGIGIFQSAYGARLTVLDTLTVHF